MHRVTASTVLIRLSSVAWSGSALCHPLGRHSGDLSWNWEAWVVVSLAASSGLYLLGWYRLSRAGNAARVLGTARVLSFAAGMLALLLALLSPLDKLAEQLFSAHMVQHLLLMLVAPPLLVYGRPVFGWLWAFPLEQRRRIGRAWISTRALHASYQFLMRPLVVWSSATVALWFWHIPGPYDSALGNEWIHTLEHLCFFVTSLAFWTLTMPPYGHNKNGQGIALLMLTTFSIHSGLLGALLTFASSPLYQAYTHSAFGLSPLEDQQLAGIIMWVPASFVYLGAMAILFIDWISHAQAYGAQH